MATIDSLTLKPTPLGTDTIELNDGQKATLASLPASNALTAHINDTEGAHAASAISLANGGNVEDNKANLDLLTGKLPPEELPDEIDARIQVLSGTDAALATEVLALGELAAPTDGAWIRKGDGVTPGGVKVGDSSDKLPLAGGTLTGPVNVGEGNIFSTSIDDERSITLGSGQIEAQGFGTKDGFFTVIQPNFIYLTDGTNETTLDAASCLINGVSGKLGHRVDVPANSSSPGATGQWASDNQYLYLYGTSGWRRVAASTF